MVHYFIKVDSEEDISDSRVAKILKFMRKISLEGSEVVCLGISLYSSEIQRIIDDLGWSSLGHRELNDLTSLFNSINDCAATENSVFFVSNYEIDVLMKNFYSFEYTSFYDIIGVRYVENKFTYEGFELLDDIFNAELSINENILLTLRSFLLPETVHLSERFRAGKHKMNKKLSKLTKKAIEIRELNEKFLNERGNKEGENEIGKRIQDATKKLMKIEDCANGNIKKCKRVIRCFKHTEKDNNFDTEKLILWPTQFSINQIELKETLMSNHCDHELVLKNNTPFHWKNLVIYIEITGKRLLEISELKPNETKNQNADYDFDLINEKGTYEFQVYYGAQAVSNKIRVSRISILNFISNDKLCNILIKNNGVKIEGCQIKIKNIKDQSEKIVTTTFQNFKETNIAVQNLSKGENYEIQVFSKGIAVSGKFVGKS